MSVAIAYNSNVATQLEDVFARCQKCFNRLSTEFFGGNDQTGNQLISELEESALKCEILIRKEHLFSINETIKDTSTGFISGYSLIL